MTKDDKPPGPRLVPPGVDPETGEVNGRRRSLRDVAGDPEGPLPGMIAGDQKQLTFSVSSPHDLVSSRLKVKGFEPGVLGQFQVGATIRLEVEVELGDPTFKRRRDAHGYVTGMDRIHGGEVIGWRRLDE